MSVKISVVIPVYNAEKYLAQCLDSILGQSLSDFEVICVDDGSTDGSSRIIAGYAAHDERIRILSQTNSGAGVARNIGLAAAAGEYVLFLDADDWFEPRYFESAVGRIEADDADICICGYESFDNSTGKILASNWEKKKELLPAASFSPEEHAERVFQFIDGQVWDKLYRRSFLERSGIKFPALRAAEDTAFAYRTFLLAKRITALPQVMVHYRLNRAGSVSRSFTDNMSAPFDSFEIIYDFLLERDLMLRYERSFKNWAMEYLVWQVNNMQDEKIQEQYLHTVREKWFPVFRFACDKNCFRDNKQAYGKYLLMNIIPYPVYKYFVRFFKAVR